MPGKQFNENTSIPPTFCQICGKPVSIPVVDSFCNEQCNDLHYKRLLKLAAMSNVKYAPGVIDTINWNYIEREYYIIWSEGGYEFIGDFEQACQYLEV
jgi:predicted nucleic acid-binding Zn ribbon protein